MPVMSESLDFSALERAIARLDEGLQRYRHDPSDLQIRDGLIQRFEFTYELSHKMLRRFLKATAADPVAVDHMSFQDLIRTGNEQGLLRGTWPQWRRYREMRGTTSHAYDEDAAMAVVSGIPDFLEEARYLCRELNARRRAVEEG